MVGDGRVLKGEMLRKYFAVPKAAGEKDAIFVTTMDADHDGDRVFPEGGDLKTYLANPVVLWLHDAYGKTISGGIPVGTTKSLEVIPTKGIKATGIKWLEGDEFAARIKNAWEQDVLRAASIGFVPTDFEPNEHGGYDIKHWKLLEWSIVPIPANPNAVRMAAGPEAFGDDEAESMVLAIKHAGGPALDRSYFDMGRQRQEPRQRVLVVDEPLRWNPRLSKAFDIAREEFEPAAVEYGLAAKYLGVAVKNLYATDDFVPAPRMGSFLSALEERLGDFVVEDVRALTGNGKECPPLHEVIELNSTQRRDFLISGIRFMRDAAPKSERRLVFKVSPDWGGLDVRVYAAWEKHHDALEFLSGTWTRAAALNFLKGEAFSLSGKFLPKTDETWADVFLTKTNEEALQRIVERLNAKGAGMDNRGVLLLGPPGTGKTLGGRVMRNLAHATFIWVSARDFYRMGAFGGLSYGFSLARECAPSILFIEDVDNWLGPLSIDLLKTEMDGIGRSKGVVTVLTTNYPELLPDALLDRPGRFHDVLKLAHPDAETRGRMLAKWMPALSEEDRARAVKETEGYSGAHLRELANFARVIGDEEGLDPAAALTKALERLREQRETINEVQTRDSRYRPTRAITEGIVKSMARTAAIGGRRRWSAAAQWPEPIPGAEPPKPARAECPEIEASAFTEEAREHLGLDEATASAISKAFAVAWDKALGNHG